MDTSPPRINHTLARIFTRYATRFLQRHMHRVRLLNGFEPRTHEMEDRPVIVYLNHPSWWDPLTGMMLSRRFEPGREHYVPIHAHALARYRLLSKIGFFPVERDTRRGATQFLRIGRAVLQHRQAMLWVTAQGHFTDARIRPLQLQPGVSHLAQSLERLTLLPLAIEYPFWEERYPELVCAFGRAIHVEQYPGLGVPQWDQLLTERLEMTMDSLAKAAMAQDLQRFTTIAQGKAGVGGVYDLGRRINAAVRGHSFKPRHGEK